MVSYIKSLSNLAALIICIGCVNEPESLPDPLSQLSEKEIELCKTWTYKQIMAKGNFYFFADANMELAVDINDVGGNRAQLFRRNIYYSPSGTYQLRWIERGDYELGTVGDPNWQPNFGYWELSGDTLYHNKGAYYQQKYYIEITDSTFRRRSTRYMSESYFLAEWEMKEWVDQTEFFILTK